MADKKISQLASASAPLSGTETIPLVQSGSTVKVSVADLTAGRPVSASSFTSSGSVTSQSGSMVSRTSTGGSFVLDSTIGGTENTITGLVNNGNLFGTINYVGFDHIFKYGAGEIFRCKNDGNIAVATGNVQLSTAGKGVEFPGGLIWRTGTGTPEGVVTAPVGSLFTRTDGGAGTTLYVKQTGTGNTGWAAK